jgi:uncharacterized phage protein (predicted DNA packaging)
MPSVSLETVKQYMRVDHEFDDALIGLMISAAEEQIRELIKPIEDEYGDPDELPDKLKMAVMVLVAHAYDQRAVVNVGRGTVQELPWAVSALIANHRAMTF